MQLQPRLARLLGEHSGAVRLLFVHMPVVAAESARAAVAAEAARRQGAFWEMHDALFALSRAPLREDELRAVISDLGLDAERFSRDLRDPELLARVARDLADVERLGIDGTPALLVNGRLLVGLHSYETLDTIVAEERADAP